MRGILSRKGMLLGLVILVLPAKAVQSDGPEDLLARIAAARSTIRTLTADFIQRKEIALFASAITSKGRMVMRAPDLLIWKVEEPLEAFFFIDRGTAGSRDPHTGEVKRYPMPGEGAARSSHAWILQVFLGSLDALKEAFRIERLQGTGELLILRLLPLENSATPGLGEILLGFEPQKLSLKEITLVEASGEKTHIRLEKIEVNGDIRKEIPSWLKTQGAE